MSLNSLHLDAFQKCAQIGNFTKAAQRLHITQSALSQRIKNLEDELETTLIIRERSGIKLTEAGTELFRYCQMRSRLEEEMMVSMACKKDHAGLSGMIRIGCFSSIARSIILPSLSDLIKDNPNLRLRLMDRELYELKPLLKSGEINFMIIDEEIKQKGVVTKILGFEKSVLVQKRGYKGPEVFLDHDEEDLTTIRYLKKKSQSEIQRSFLDDIYGIIDGVRLGLGKAIVPIHLISKRSDLEIIEPTHSVTVPVVLHYYDQPFYSQLHKAVEKALVDYCSKVLSQ